MKFGWFRFKKTLFLVFNANKKTITLVAMYYKVKTNLITLFSFLKTLFMKKIFLTSIAIMICLVGNVFAQQITKTKTFAVKQATVKVSGIEQKQDDSGIKYKRPNPFWKPPDWSYADDKVIFRQPESTPQTTHSKLREDSPLPVKSFAGLKDNNTSIPPDVYAAAGPDHIMQALNTEVRISDKEGVALFTTTLSSFWSSLPGSNNTFDPRIVYDPFSGKWIMVTPSGTGGMSRIYFAVSTSSDPLGDWNMYWFDPDVTNQTWFDYPNLGFNKNWISIGGIMRNAQFEAVEYVVFAIDKQAATAGEDSPAVSKFTTTLGSAMVPAITYDTTVKELYLISTGDGNDNGYGYINLFELSGDVEDPDFELKGSVGVPAPWENWSYENHGDFLPQKDSEYPLNSVDARMQAMICRNGKLWAVHHIYLPADAPERTSIQWWQLDTSGVLLERGRIDDPDGGMSFAFPGLAVNAHEDMLIGHGDFSEQQYAGAGYSFQAYYDDSGTIRNYYEYKEGLAPYYKTYGGGRNRWGDYSAVFVDPEDDINMWAIHEYAELPDGSDQWGTWWAYVMPSFPPVADFTADNILIPTGEYVNFTDLTAGVPENWNWTFEGGEPNTSSLQNPDSIHYSEEGTFTVSLIASNDLGTDTIVKEAYITVSSSILPDVDFTADKELVCTTDTVSFTDLSKYKPIQWDWQFDPADVTFVDSTNHNSQNPRVVFNRAVKYSVTLTVWNLNGSSELTKTGMITAGGIALYYIETFDSITLDSSYWTVENPDDDITWQLFDLVNGDQQRIAAGVNFSEYYYIGERDRLISPPFNLEGLSSAWLSFQHAYAAKYPGMTDSLIVYVSPDCGASWTRVFAGGEDGSGNFATHERTDNFWPVTDEDWCMAGWGAPCIDIDLTPWAGLPNVRVAFETYSNYGNPLMIDNVSISQFLGTGETALKNDELQVFPNPSDGSFTVIIPRYRTMSHLQLTNRLGQTVYSLKLTGKSKHIDVHLVNKLASGLYFLKISGTGKPLTGKIVVR